MFQHVPVDCLLFIHSSVDRLLSQSNTRQSNNGVIHCPLFLHLIARNGDEAERYETFATGQQADAKRAPNFKKERRGRCSTGVSNQNNVPFLSGLLLKPCVVHLNIIYSSGRILSVVINMQLTSKAVLLFLVSPSLLIVFYESNRR